MKMMLSHGTITFTSRLPHADVGDKAKDDTVAGSEMWLPGRTVQRFNGQVIEMLLTSRTAKGEIVDF